MITNKKEVGQEFDSCSTSFLRAKKVCDLALLVRRLAVMTSISQFVRHVSALAPAGEQAKGDPADFCLSEATPGRPTASE